MNKKCSQCNLINFQEAEKCKRCAADLQDFKTAETVLRKPKLSLRAKILRRALVCLVVFLFTLFGFYLSLLVSANRLSFEEKQRVENAVKLLEEKGFDSEVFLLRYLTAYRANDNWLNASIEKENAYAATNFPFEIMTIYQDFFIYPVDDTERAAILLHEAQHLKGADEKEAYKYVWENRKKLGWTKEKYTGSILWQNVRKQTREYLPEMFGCGTDAFRDCTE